MNKKRSIIVIPSRYGSTRLPGKPLIKILGTSLLERVWRIAKHTQANEVYIATDDQRINEFAQGFGAKVIMTSKDCKTGTDRVAEVAKILAPKDNPFFINLQGDALLTPPWVIDDIIKQLPKAKAPILTPARKLTGSKITEFLDHKKISPSSGTTVVFNKNHLAMYFSKNILPFDRNNYKNLTDISIFKHIGLYAYQYQTLLTLTELTQSPLEKIEQLEQLRALENNIPIQIVEVDYRNRTEASIDTREDIPFVEALIDNEGEIISL